MSKRKYIDLRPRTYLEFEKSTWDGGGYDLRYYRNGILKHGESGFHLNDIEKILRLFKAAGIDSEEFKNGSIERPRFRRESR